MKFLNSEKLILASQSPRRKELLQTANINIKVQASTVDESKIRVCSPEKFVQDLARLKAVDVAVSYPESWVLGADTIVVCDGDILGKPDSRKMAVSMLEQLNNRPHIVYTGFCLFNKKLSQSVTRAVSTKVVFKPLSNEEINWYVDTKDPFDKAGGYGIQGIGAFLVKKIDGSYTNVVGLPVCEVIESLLTLNLIQM